MQSGVGIRALGTLTQQTDVSKEWLFMKGQGRCGARSLVVCLILFCAGVYAQGPAAKSSASTPQPPYLSQRYDEDWSYLSDRAKESDAFDRLKYIPLNKPGWYFARGRSPQILATPLSTHACNRGSG